MDAIVCVGLLMIVNWTTVSFEAAVCCEILKTSPIIFFFFHVIADNSLLTSVEGAHLECVIKKHPALDSAMHLLPENALVSGDENIPGLMSSPTGKSHQPVSGEKPKMARVKIGINRIKDHRRTVEKRKLQADGQTACCASSQILFTALSLNLFDMFWCSLTTSSLRSHKHLMCFFFDTEWKLKIISASFDSVSFQVSRLGSFYPSRYNKSMFIIVRFLSQTTDAAVRC